MIIWSPVDKVLRIPVLVCNYTPQHGIGETHSWGQWGYISSQSTSHCLINVLQTLTIYHINHTQGSDSRQNTPCGRYLDNIYTWIDYYILCECSNMLNSVTVWYLLCWSAELITQCNGCLDDFTPRQTLGSMKTTCFFYLPNSDYVTLANTIDIWTKWILNKALPTFFCFSLPQYLRTLALSFCVYSNRWLQWMHATLHY